MSTESLEQFVNRIAQDRGLSSYAVERASSGGISQSQVNRIQNGEVKQPSPSKLKALAKGLGVPETELFAVVRGVKAERNEVLHERLVIINNTYAGLTKKRRKQADYLIELLEREIRHLSDLS